MTEEGAAADDPARLRPWTRPRLETLHVDRTAADQDPLEDALCFGGLGAFDCS